MTIANNIVRRSLFLAGFLLTLLSLDYIALAPAEAQTAWREGVITSDLWTDKYNHITVDGRTYTLMPKVIIEEMVQKGDQYYQEYRTVSDLRKGLKVWIDVQGSRIYQILYQN
jgi:hypothetical protein